MLNNFRSLVLVAVLSSTQVSGSAYLRFDRAAYEASSFVGVSTSAIFPVPNATNAASEYDSYFPDATQVGYPGPTPTGDEAELIATATSVPKVSDYSPLLNPSTQDNKTSFNVLRSFGNLAPMFSVDSLGLPEANELIPEGCELNQVHLLHRHGARYPTSTSPPAKFAARLHSAVVNGTGFTAKGDLDFLNTWSYKLGAELLTPFGRQQLFELGVSFRIKYGELLKKFTGLPVFRTTSEERMVQSAQNFAAGFFGIPEFLTDYRQVITVEVNDVHNNNTLNAICSNSGKAGVGDTGTNAQNAWADIYLRDALQRLQPQIEGFNLTITDLIGMQTTCAYETVALGTSAFCDLFTEEEFKGLSYFFDLQFWYANGPGSATSAATGIGYVQELVSRLTKTTITVHNSTTNSTITENPILFPLDQPIFVDASHDTNMASILVALNFTSFGEGGPLPTDHIPENQTYFVNTIAPFAAQYVAQVLSCPASSSPTHIRWLVNDAVVPLTGISGCPENKDGLCPIETFIEAMQTRLGEVDFNYACNGNYTIADPYNIVDGLPPADQRP